MGIFKPRGVAIVLNGEERHFLFTLNMIDQIEEKYDKPLMEVLEDVANDTGNGHLMRDIVVILLNDEAERNKRMKASVEYSTVTEADVGDMIGLDNYYEVMKALLKAYGRSMPEVDEEEDPNQKSGQMKS